MSLLPADISQSFHIPSSKGDPTWELALSFPRQGEWTEEAYLELEQEHFVELVDGCLEFLPMPTYLHQLIVRFLHRQLDDFVRDHAEGEVLFAPFPVRLSPKNYREPDIIYLRPENIPPLDKTSQGADLVVEVVSPGKVARERDLEAKRVVYAKAGIAEYWIIDPEEKGVCVLALAGEEYREHGVFAPGDMASSVLLDGFAVAVDDILSGGGAAKT